MRMPQQRCNSATTRGEARGSGAPLQVEEEQERGASFLLSCVVSDTQLHTKVVIGIQQLATPMQKFSERVPQRRGSVSWLQRTRSSETRGHHLSERLTPLSLSFHTSQHTCNTLCTITRMLRLVEAGNGGALLQRNFIRSS